MPHQAITMKAKDGKNVDEVDIFGTIGEDWWGESTSAATVLEAIRSSEAKTIHVNINSGGGSIFEGMAMYDAIREAKAKTKARVIGFAGSMASVVMLAADSVEIVDGSLVMIHNPSSVAMGEAKDLRKQADVLDKLRQGIVRIYDSKTGLGEEEIIAMLDEETWLDAEEAKSLGFVDKIVGDDGEAAVALASLDLTATAPAAKIPLRFAATLGGVSRAASAGKMQAIDPGEDFPVQMKQINVELDDDASDEDILAAVREALGADADDADDEQDDADEDPANEADEDPAGEDDELEPAGDDEDEEDEEEDDAPAALSIPEGFTLVDNDVLEGLRERAAKADAPETFDARDKGIVDEAIRLGKIPAAKRKKYVDALKADFETFKAVLDGLPRGLVPVDGELGTSHEADSADASGATPVDYDRSMFPQLATSAATDNPIIETE